MCGGAGDSVAVCDTYVRRALTTLSGCWGGLCSHGC